MANISLEASLFLTKETGKVQELKIELSAAKRDRKDVKKRIGVLKRIIANTTMGNDMSLLFRDVLDCLNMDSLETKKMVLLYLCIYAKKNPQLTLEAVNALSLVLI